MTYRQKSYGGLLLILAVVVVIGYASDIPVAVLAPLIAFLVLNLLFVEVGRYFIVGKPSNGKKAWTYRQKHYTEFILGIGLNAIAIYFLPFPSLVWIVLLAAFIINIVTIEIKHALINEP
ncbi:hypothetical protein [Marinococcus halotolerans]|uniref:hypothetical protein n=1 Tax=Marinococcus halotolerans TaxID=301092 RepID=UPI0003B70D2C|nr:hypothetical protein [Marinococcus halotolerans]